MTKFDATAYWTRTVPGIDELMPFTPLTPEHAAQEEALLDVLRGLEFDSALEVGCGLGRITMLLAEMTDDLAAIDIGADQVAVTSKRVSAASIFQSRIQDFAPDRHWDLVVASEVLMHIPPSDIQAVCDKLKRLASKWVVTVDWTEPMEGEIAPENWLHDYPGLFGSVERSVRTGLQTIYVIQAVAA